MSTQGIITAVFEITDSLNHTWYFEKIFLIADIPQPMVLKMLFLKLGDLDVSWIERTI